MGWRDGSMGKSTWYPCRVSWSNSKHTHGGSQLSIIPVPGNKIFSSDSHWTPGLYIANTYIQANTHTNKINNNNINI